ncbi:hypothetical protein XA68_10239 [Ophiocordyceps unilateralis]|uniref:FAD-binding domain-containing protein n=1 Tax=Ophiocordyceps unilateralis TaxID=268505 RepID=A0A2A9PIU9_OPHUN|nr:hypothetical protein XA68_10239 [Ophiocordyceps unilateralis]
MSNPSPHILIIGAGVGGLTLAQGLKRSGISFQVYERDAMLDSRLQGYRLKIPGETVVKLSRGLTAAAWTTLTETSGLVHSGETNVNAVDASILACRKKRLAPDELMPLAVDRGLLRRALSDGIEDHVTFGKRLVSWERLDNNKKVSAVFADGSRASGSLLVGADGARSVLRPWLLPGYEPRDSGICCIYGKTTLDAQLQAQFPEKHRRWITVVRDQTPVIEAIVARRTSPVTMVCEPCRFSHRESYPFLPPDYVHFAILFPTALLGHHLSEEQVDHLLRSDAPAVALDIASEWHPSIRSLIELQDRHLTHGIRVLSAPAPIPVWESAGVVTMMGDAVHLMSPAGGVGAVATLEDALLLADVITDEGVTPASMARFEQCMRDSASVYIRRSLLAGSRFLDLPYSE